MKTSIKIAIGLIISIVLIIYLLIRIDLPSVIQALGTFNHLTFLFLLLIFITGMLSRSIRWQKLLSYKEYLSLWFVFKALSIGYMVNNLLPAKIGELARMEYIKRKKGIGRSFLLGTIFIERLIDVMLVMIIFTFSLVFSQTGRTVFFQNKWIILVIIVIIFVSIYVLLKPGLIIRLSSFLPLKFRSFFEKSIRSFSDSIHFAHDQKLLFWVSFQSLFIWSLTLLSSFLILRGLNVYLPFYGYFFLVAVGVLGLVIPSTSGGIGVYHAISTGALVLLGIVPEKALAYAIIAHAFDFFPNVVIGLIIAAYEGFTLKNLSVFKVSD